MAVASHLHINLDEYDERIRTFIPGYENLVTAAAGALGAVATEHPHIVDLGTGTGALAARCLHHWPTARLTAIDEDDGILELARRRLAALSPGADFLHGNFTELALPSCEAIVASLALHHIRSVEAKQAFYGRCFAALAPGGLLISADCCPAADHALREAQFATWRAHLRQSYSESETDEYFAAWAADDVYFPLSTELAMLTAVRFAPEVVWRDGPMAVIAARIPRHRK